MAIGVGRPCTCCTHPRRREIDKHLVEGTALRTISKTFGLTVQAIIRHRDNHLSQILRAAEEEQRIADKGAGAALVDRIHVLSQRVEGLTAAAYRGGDIKTALQGVRESTRLLELHAKMNGEIPPPTVNLTMSVEFRTLQVTLLAALDPYPEAKAAVLRALQGATGSAPMLDAA